MIQGGALGGRKFQLEPQGSVETSGEKRRWREEHVEDCERRQKPDHTGV